jgi:ubiquitin-protein ligase
VFRAQSFINSRWNPEMSEKKVVKVLLSQLEEALEERQNNDRRKQTLEDIENDRRKNDRRDSQAK